MPFNIRFWGSTAVLLCALLVQSCQLHSVSATEEEDLSASASASAVRQRTPSEPLVLGSLASPFRFGASSTSAAPASLFHFSEVSAGKERSSVAVQALVSKKLANPEHTLSDRERIALLTYCVSEGARNAEKLKGKDALVVVGKTGVGKSTFLNYLLGCKLELLSPAGHGLANLEDIAVVSPDSVVKEIMPIGHTRVPKTLIPQIAVDRTDASVVYCDCPGFLDDRGAEINIAQAVNIRRVLQSARSTKMLVLIDYPSLKSGRGEGMHDNMLKLCTQLFGSISQLSHYKDSLLLGITKVPATETLVRLRSFLSQGGSPMLKILAERVFLYDPVEAGAGKANFWNRLECHAQFGRLQGIPQRDSGRLFQTALTDSDECALIKIVGSQKESMCSLLSSGDYAQSASSWQALERLRVLDNLSVERLLHMSEKSLSSKFHQLVLAFKDACYAYDFPKSDQLLRDLSQIAGFFSEELYNFSLSALQACHRLSKERHAVQGHSEDEASIREATSEQEQLPALVETQKTSLPPAEAFGASAWQQYYGEVGEAPALPADIESTLDAPCPFWKSRGKKVRDTHLLVLIPAQVDGKPFTLNLLGELIKSPKGGGSKTQYGYYQHYVQSQVGNEAPASSYWVLLTRDVLPKSRDKAYAAQKELVSSHASRTGVSYELPKALEAATAILMHHVRTGECLYGDDPWTYTRFQELIRYNSDDYAAVVGGFGPSGLDVSCGHYGRCDGVAGCRKFF